MSALGGPVGFELGRTGRWPVSVPSSAMTSGVVLPVADRVVHRAAVLAELRAVDPAVLVTLCAPAGFGKSTVLSQWADVDPRLFPWLTLTQSHNDRTRLLGDLAIATASLRAASGNGLRLLPDVAADASSGPAASAEAILGAIAGPFVLVLDDAHVLTDGWPVIDELIDAVPASSAIAIASRRAVPNGVGSKTRLRRRRIDITDRELAFDALEAHIALGPDVSHATAMAVVDRCDGWPMAVFLTGHSSATRSDRNRSRQTGHDNGVLEFLRREVLAGLDDATTTFLTRAAVLGELSGSLCDAVCNNTGSGLMLRGRLSDSLLVVAVPGRTERYRLHRLLRRVLRADLAAREPDLIPELHARASRWFAAHGQLDAAVAHAKRSGDMARLANLIWPSVRIALENGGIGRLCEWLAELTDNQIGESPDLIAIKAWLSVLNGEPDQAIRWQALGEAREGRDWRSEIGRSERRGLLALLRAWRAGDGGAATYADSSAAFHELPADSVWRPSAGALSGLALAWSGRAAQARARLADSEELARALGNPAARADCLAALACLAFDEGDQSRAQHLVAQVGSVLLDHQLIDFPGSAFAVSVVAVGLARAGRAADAADMLNRSLALTEAMAGFMPWLQLQNRILQADSCVLIGDIAAARRLTRQANDVLLRQRADHDGPPALRASLRRTESLLALLPADSRYGSVPFTLAESRILQLLPTHLSFPEMAVLLFNSRHTVKTQALAVYRKLGANSRSEAVERAQTLGYLPPTIVPDALVPIRTGDPGASISGRRYSLVPSPRVSQQESVELDRRRQL